MATHTNITATEPTQTVEVEFMGYTAGWTWEQEMEWATQDLSDADKAAVYEKYGALRAEQLAKDVTPIEGKARETKAIVWSKP